MHMRRIKLGELASIFILAACMAGVVNARASQATDNSGDSSDVPAKQAVLHKRTDAKAKQKHTARKDQSKVAALKPEENEVSLLKQQIALQQNQINQLLHAVSELNARLGSLAQPAPVAPTARPASNAEVASLVPILPPEPKAPAEATSKLLSMNTSVNPGGTAGGNTALGSASQPGSGAANAIAEAPAAEKQKAGPLEFDHGKIKLGATFYGDYAYYANTGFGPQFLTQINQAGPGNDGFNSFDVNRTYLNFFYSPTDDITLRFTPNIYRQVGGATAQSDGKNAAIGSSVNGNLGFRLKYAYVDFNHPFKNSEAFGKDKITIGQTTNPLVDWEESLYGYRYVNLTPWNYLSLSSTYVGATIHGPIEFNGKEYLDYHLGVFNNASFHAIEQNDQKQVMGRLTWYPVGTTSDRTGFGLTGFMDYGYGSAFPDSRAIPLYRVALLGHYQTHDKGYLIAAEYDLGRNAFGLGNMFSGSGPADAFGLPATPYAGFTSLARAILGGDHTRQQGFDFFGHARLGGAKSPWGVFGMYEYFQPNTNVSKNPLDFQRLVAGISYKYNKYLEFALDGQNLIYTQSQFTFPAGELPGITTPVSNAVPNNTNAIFFNVLFNY